jgi:putative transposase
MNTGRHRPPRLDRIFSGVRPFYFITFNTHQRAATLASPEVHACFRAFAEKAGEHGVAVGRYVIMPDHVHLFVVLSEGGLTLARWVQSLKAVLGKTLLAQGRPKPHWQEGFFDHLLRSGESYGEKWDYVRLNPVRARLVETPEAWPYQGEIEVLQF